MKKTTIYRLRSLLALLSLSLLYAFISRLRGNITYAYESKQYQDSILSTTNQISGNSAQWNLIDKEILELQQKIQTLREKQQELKQTNQTLRQSLTDQKKEYQEFLGFHSGT